MPDFNNIVLPHTETVIVNNKHYYSKEYIVRMMERAHDSGFAKGIKGKVFVVGGIENSFNVEETKAKVKEWIDQWYSSPEIINR